MEANVMRLRLPLVVLSALSLLAGCRSETTPPPSPASSAASAVSVPATALPSASAAAGPRSISPEQHRAFSSLLRRGRSLAGEKRWGEAVPVFEKALTIVPHDPRALLDLGWAAFQAGDRAKARKATAEAEKHVTEGELRAQVLYNLGRIEEAGGQRDAAARHYAESVKLRPNETVSARLADLARDAKPRAPRPALPCSKPLPLDALCSCLSAEVAPAEAGEDEVHVTACEMTDLAPSLSQRARILRVATSANEETFFLAASNLLGWSVVADVSHSFNPGAFGISESFSVERAEIREVAGSRVLWLETKLSHHDSDMGIDEEEEQEIRRATFCLLPDERRRDALCTLDVPLSSRFRRQRSGLIPDAELDADTKLAMTPGLPIDRRTTFALDLSPDGVATLKLVKGVATPEDRALLGPHSVLNRAP
jgi:hypothetical protein